MQRAKKVILFLAGALSCLPFAGRAQENTLNSYSPYTFYGIGELHSQGPAFLRSMGGASVGFRSGYVINYTNPASYSAISRQSFLFNFGMEGQNVYEKQNSSITGKVARSEYNSFNVRDIAVQMPLYRKIGFGVSVTPLSSVGYRAQSIETDPDIVADLGQVKYLYEGDGGLTQVKAGVGIEVVKNLSLGAEFIYYWGNIERNFETSVYSVTGDGTYNKTSASDKEVISRVNVGFGLQYNIFNDDNHILTVGATYQPSMKLRAEMTRLIEGNNVASDTVVFAESRTRLALPDAMTVGVTYQRRKYVIGADYTYRNWGDKNDYKLSNNAKYINTNAVNVGGQYTPNRGDVRKYLNRISYRIGYKYSDYYVQFGGRKLKEQAITCGFGLPLKMSGASAIDIGFEYGVRGTTRDHLVRDTYFKFSVGLSLFGEDFWFMKRKYD